MRQVTTKDQMKWMYTIMGNNLAITNEKYPCLIVGFKRPRHEKYEIIHL